MLEGGLHSVFVGRRCSEHEPRANQTGTSFNETITLVCTEWLVVTVWSIDINATHTNKLGAFKIYLLQPCQGNQLAYRSISQLLKYTQKSLIWKTRLLSYDLIYNKINISVGIPLALNLLK